MFYLDHCGKMKSLHVLEPDFAIQLYGIKLSATLRRNARFNACSV